MNTLEEYILAKIDAAFEEAIGQYRCVRDGAVVLGEPDDLWCPVCGMHPKAEGPARPPRFLEGVSFLTT